jgi:hypothetical protein
MILTSTGLLSNRGHIQTNQRIGEEGNKALLLADTTTSFGQEI